MRLVNSSSLWFSVYFLMKFSAWLSYLMIYQLGILFNMSSTWILPTFYVIINFHNTKQCSFFYFLAQSDLNKLLRPSFVSLSIILQVLHPT